MTPPETDLQAIIQILQGTNRRLRWTVAITSVLCVLFAVTTFLAQRDAREANESFNELARIVTKEQADRIKQQK